MPRINIQTSGTGMLLSLFPDLEIQEPDDQGYGLQPQPQIAVTIKEDRNKEIKEYCKELEKLAENEDIQAILGMPSTVNIDRSLYEFINNKELIPYDYEKHGMYPITDIRLESEGWGDTVEIKINVLHLCKNGDIWCVPITFEKKGEYRNGKTYLTINNIRVGKPFQNNKKVTNAITNQNKATLHEILANTKPYVEEWLKAHPSFLISEYLNTPWMETLDKAGYKIAGFVLGGMISHSKTDIEQLNRLCKRGNSPKEIFKTTKAVYSVLKDDMNVAIWDMYRKLDKTGKITQDTIRMAYNANWSIKELNYVNSILAKKYEDKPVFTWTSLTNYLGRLDMFEAISHAEALPILCDYLNMCNQLGIKPRTDSDSLKREHDVAARLIRQKHNEILTRKMELQKQKEQKMIEEGNRKLAKLEYHENVYFVRPITEYNDLIDEATQQENCVASYANMIAKGQTRILTMRESAHPEKSLVTIELSVDCRQVKQKFLAHNQPIRNKSMSEFIDRWMKQLNS